VQLRERVFLLLGGSGGIGRALIGPLVNTGARVIVASRNPAGINDSRITTVCLDLSAADLAEGLDDLSDDHPDIDGVIHCAGRNLFAAVDRTPVQDLDDLLSVNLRSAILVARHFVPRFRQQGRGAMVFVGSTFGSIGFPGHTAYCASKFGLRGLTEALRRELADTPVQVLYVAPRATRTAMNPESVNALNEVLGNHMDAPEHVAGQIIQAMERNQRCRYLGWPEKFLVHLNSVLPRLVDGAVLRQLPVIRRFLPSGVSS
jgi:short-subunit dehydrogenase